MYLLISFKIQFYHINNNTAKRKKAHRYLQQSPKE